MPDQGRLQSDADLKRLLEELRQQMQLPMQPPLGPTRAPEPTVQEILAALGGNRDWQNQMPVAPSRGPMGPTRIGAAPDLPPPVMPRGGPMGPTSVGAMPMALPPTGPMGPTRIGPAGPQAGFGTRAPETTAQEILASLSNKDWQNQMPVGASRGPMGPTRIGPAGASPAPTMPGRGPMGPTRIGPNATQLPPQLEGVTAQSIIDSISPTLSKFRQSQSPMQQVMDELERAKRGEPEDVVPEAPPEPVRPRFGGGVRPGMTPTGRPAGTRSTPAAQAKAAIGKLPSMPFDHEQLQVPISPEDLGLSRESVPNIIGAGAGGTALHGGVLPTAPTHPMNAAGPLNSPLDVKPSGPAAPKPMPAWKQIMVEAFRSLPSAMVHFAAAKYDRPDIAENWLKQRALKIQAAQDQAELEAKMENDSQLRAIKLQELQNGKNGHIQSITNRITDLHARVAEGKLKDINSYFAMLQMAGNEIQALGGDGRAFIEAFPIPQADRFDALRKQFSEYTEKFGFDDKALDAAPFIDPLDDTNKQHITGHQVARILGQIDPGTGRALLPIGDVTRNERLEKGRPTVSYDTKPELRARGNMTPIPPAPPPVLQVPVITTDEAGNMQVTQVTPSTGQKTAPVTVSGVSKDIASDITGAQKITADVLRRKAAEAILLEERGSPAPNQDVNALMFTTDKVKQAKVNKKMAELDAAAKAQKKIQ